MMKTLAGYQSSTKINFMPIKDYHFQNRSVDFRFIVSFGMFSLGVWEVFFIIIGKGTLSLTSHIQCVPSCCFILASEIQSSFLQSKRPPRSWNERSTRKNLRQNLATVPESPPSCIFSECGVIFECLLCDRYSIPQTQS